MRSFGLTVSTVTVVAFPATIESGAESPHYVFVLPDSYVGWIQVIFDAANPRGQLGTQQARVGGFVRQATHGCKQLVDGVGGQMSRFQVHAIADDHDAVEGQPRLGVVPGDELVDSVLVHSTRSRRAEDIENCRFTMIPGLAGGARGDDIGLTLVCP